jgi:hypothetical protein
MLRVRSAKRSQTTISVMMTPSLMLFLMSLVPYWLAQNGIGS